MLTTILDDIEDALNAAGALQSPPIKFSTLYGRGNTSELLIAVASKTGSFNIISSPMLNTEDEVMREDNSDLNYMTLFMATVTKNDKDSVAALHNWFKMVGYVKENGIIGRPPKAPYIFQGLEVHQWAPSKGGVLMGAEQIGEWWICYQECDVALRKP